MQRDAREMLICNRNGRLCRGCSKAKAQVFSLRLVVGLLKISFAKKGMYSHNRILLCRAKRGVGRTACKLVMGYLGR